MPLHAPEMGRDTRRQLFFTGFAHRPHAGVNAAAARGDLEVVQAFGAPIKLLGPSGSEGRVGVGVDKTG